MHTGYLALNWILFYVGFKLGYRKVRILFKRWNNDGTDA